MIISIHIMPQLTPWLTLHWSLSASKLKKMASKIRRTPLFCWQTQKNGFKNQKDSFKILLRS